jgi:magnesium transporter
LSGFYEHLLSDLIVLALFIPVVLALAESVGMQSMTLTLQRLHGEKSGRSEIARAVGREFLVALALGLACGGTVGCIAYLWKGDGIISLSIGSSIALAMLTSCLLAVAIPSTVHALKVDPRIAAGPIVLASVDIATLLFYFNLSLAVLGA